MGPPPQAGTALIKKAEGSEGVPLPRGLHLVDLYIWTLVSITVIEFSVLILYTKLIYSFNLIGVMQNIYTPPRPHRCSKVGEQSTSEVSSHNLTQV